MDGSCRAATDCVRVLQASSLFFMRSGAPPAVRSYCAANSLGLHFRGACLTRLDRARPPLRPCAALCGRAGKGVPSDSEDNSIILQRNGRKCDRIDLIVICGLVGQTGMVRYSRWSCSRNKCFQLMMARCLEMSCQSW